MNGTFIFIAMVFATVVLLTAGLTVPVFGEGNKMRKRLKQRMDELDAESGEECCGEKEVLRHDVESWKVSGC